MDRICQCVNTLNFGIPVGVCDAGEAVHAVFSGLTKSNGDDLCVDSSSALDKAYFDALFNAENVQDRLFVQKNIEQVAPIFNDDIADTSNTVAARKISTGVRGLTYVVVTKEPQKLEKAYNAIQCDNVQMWTITEYGNLAGKKVGDCLYGRKIQRIQTQVIEKSVQNTTVGKLQVTIEFKISEKDSQVDYVVPAADANLLNPISLIDVECEILTATANDTTFKLFTCYGGVNDRILVDNLTETEIEVYNVTDAGAITLAGGITNTNGVYAANFAAAEAGTIRIQGVGGNAVQSGYDLKLVPEATKLIS